MITCPESQARLSSEMLFRSLARYHLRNAETDAEERHWRSTLGMKEPTPRPPRALRKPTALPDTEAEAIVKKAARLAGVASTRIYTSDRDRPVNRARKAVCFVLHRRYPDLSLGNIAMAVGRVDHTTAHHAIRTAKSLYQRGGSFKTFVDELEATC